MKMTFRWYGSQMDPIPLRYIKQIPNMSGVVSSLMDMPAGALWPTERIQALKQDCHFGHLYFYRDRMLEACTRQRKYKRALEFEGEISSMVIKSGI